MILSPTSKQDYRKKIIAKVDSFLRETFYKSVKEA